METLIAWLDEERGRRNKLAAHLEIGPGAISQWEKVPAERMGEVSHFTGIPMEELRADIFEAAARPVPAPEQPAGEIA